MSQEKFGSLESLEKYQNLIFTLEILKLSGLNKLNNLWQKS